MEVATSYLPAISETTPVKSFSVSCDVLYSPSNPLFIWRRSSRKLSNWPEHAWAEAEGAGFADSHQETAHLSHRCLWEPCFKGSTNPPIPPRISWTTPRSFHRDQQGSLLPTSSISPGAWAADFQKPQFHFWGTTTALTSTDLQRGLPQLPIQHILGSCRTHSCHPAPPTLTSRGTFLSLI